MKPSKKRIRKLIREERASSKMYRRYGLSSIARDERKHARRLKRLLK